VISRAFQHTRKISLFHLVKILRINSFEGWSTNSHLIQGLPKLLKFQVRKISGTNSDFQHVWEKPLVCAKKGRGFPLCFHKSHLSLVLHKLMICP
jgi:hypothetical protein